LPYGDTEGFAAAIQSLMEDEALRTARAAAAREKAERRFDLNKLALEVYRSYE